MDLTNIIFVLFIVLSLNNIVHYGLYLIGANIYDIRALRATNRKPKRAHRQAALVSVLIPAHNEEAGIERCLHSVITNTYRKMQVIVIDDASSDTTARLVRNFIANHPGKNISLIHKRKNVGKAHALNYALRRHTQGDLIMTLDADSVLSKHAIKNAVAYFADKEVVGVAANVRIMEQMSALGMLQKFEHLIGYRSKKFYSIANAEFVVGGVASTYRRDTIKQAGYYSTETATEDIGLSLKIVAQGNKHRRIVYGANVVAHTEGVQSFMQLIAQRYRWKLGSLQNIIQHHHIMFSRRDDISPALKYYRLPMAFISELLLIIEPIIFGTVVVAALRLNSFGLFIGAYITITGLVLATVWPDEHYSTKRKVIQTAQAPLVYFLFHIMNQVQIVSIIRCLWHPSKLLANDPSGSVWKSPTRIGNNALSPR